MVTKFGPLGPNAKEYYITYSNGEQGYDWDRVRAEHLAELSDEDKVKMERSCADIVAKARASARGTNTAIERQRAHEDGVLERLSGAR